MSVKEHDVKSSIEYKTNIVDETKIINIEWTIPDIINVLAAAPRGSERRRKRENREIHPEQYEHTEDSVDSRFQLKMQTLGHNNDIIEIYYLSPTPVILKSRMTTLRWNQLHFSDNPLHFNKEYHTVQINKWHYMTTLFKHKMYEYKHSNGDLHLYFEFVIANNVKVQSADSKPETQLCNDYEYLLNNSLFSDVTIKSIEGTEYKVHKAVLIGRSAVLKAHFEHNTTECQANIIKTSLESNVLREVLTCIYSGKVPNIAEFPEKLLAAADYYQLIDLKTFCEEALHKKLTADNAIEIIQLADMYSGGRLKQLTLEFIKSCRAMSITKTKGWANLQSAQLIKEIFEYVLADDNDSATDE